MTTPSAPAPLVTDEELAGALGHAPTDDERARFATAAAAIRRAAGWHIGPTITETMVLDADGGSRLAVPTGHIVSVAAVVIDEIDITAYTKWSAGGWLKRRHGRFPDDPRSVTVTLDHGLPAGTYPDLVDLVAQVAGRTTEVAAAAGIAQESNGARSTTYREPGLFAYERQQLAAFAVGPTA